MACSFCLKLLIDHCISVIYTHTHSMYIRCFTLYQNIIYVSVYRYTCSHYLVVFTQIFSHTIAYDNQDS